MHLADKQGWHLIQRQPKIEQTQKLLLDLISSKLGNKNS